MKQLILFLSILSGYFSALGQTTISGVVTDAGKNPISGANVFINGTYDGSTTLDDGSFSFSTTAAGEQVLVVSYVSYLGYNLKGNVEDLSELKIILREDVNTLDAVVLSAGTFEAGEKSRVSVLTPLDIVTTAGSAGDIVAALQTLPGTQTVGESGRLFVRGGEAGETQTFVDGLRVAQPYGASVQNVPSRGRFSPFLFSGISFSTGGYSAEYGNALSSVLLLNTQDLVDESKTEISLMTVGLGLGHTQKWEKSSLTFNSSYINLSPYQAAVPQNLTWNKAFESLSGETIYRRQFNSGIWKTYAAFDASNFDINRVDINNPNPVRVDLQNNNFYLNSSYDGTFGNSWNFTAGVSYGYSQTRTGIHSILIKDVEHASHLKAKLSKRITNSLKLSMGVDNFTVDFNEQFLEAEQENFKAGFNSNHSAVYTEASILFSKKFAMNLGLRASYDDLLYETNISPRLSMAYKTGQNSQFSMAYGKFNQTPGNEFLKFSKNFSSQKAAHYILNYQYSKNKRLFRTEAYYKDYSNLIKYDTDEVNYDSVFSNSGIGYAGGLDIFWRDGKSIKNMEYWLSYSFIDSEREYRNFPTSATPNFIAAHNASLVTKYFISDLRSQLGISYSYGSGRPYHDPNTTEFMKEKTKEYNNLSFSWAYLLSQQKILYFSVSNVLGVENIFGYEYSKNPDNNGFFNRQAIVPTADRFFFVGLFWTISSNKKINQLETL